MDIVQMKVLKNVETVNKARNRQNRKTFLRIFI